MPTPSEVTLRPAVPGDADAVAGVLAPAYATLLAPYYAADLLARAMPLMSRADPSLLASGTYYVAERAGGVPVACGGWTWEAPGSDTRVAGVAHIRHFGTHPVAAGRGIASRLLAHCLHEACSAGVRYLICHATLPAETFYRRAGFRSLGPIEVAMDGGLAFPGIEMGKSLE